MAADRMGHLTIKVEAPEIVIELLTIALEGSTVIDLTPDSIFPGYKAKIMEYKKEEPDA